MSAGTKISPSHMLTRELAPVISRKYALTWQHTVLVVWFSLSFAFVNHLPLSLQSTWWHALQGKWILSELSVPQAIPYAPLADGMPYVATSWLSDAIIAWGLDRFGFEFLSATMAVITNATIGLWCWLCYRETQQKRYVLLVAIGLTVAWSSGMSELRPQVFGGLLYPILMWLVWPSLVPNRFDSHLPTVVRCENSPSYRAWVGTLCVMVVWANLDVSFVLGVMTLVCLSIGKIVSSARDIGFGKLIRDRRVRRSVLFAESAAIVTLLSPNSWATWASVLRFDGHGPVWSKAGGDFGLRLATGPGMLFGLLVVLVIVLWQLSRVAKHIPDVCLIFVAVVATAMNQGNIYWLAPIVGLLAAKHWRDVAEQRRWLYEDKSKDNVDRNNSAAYNPMMFAWSLISLLVVWCAFAFSPVSNPLLSTKNRPVERLFASDIPLDVSEFLKREKAAGVAWSPADWSDWLLWSNGEAIQPIVHTPMQSFPATVQRDYARIFHADAEWDNIAKQYNVTTIVIDKRRQGRLAKEVIRSSRWRLAHETDRALVLFVNGAKP